MTLMYERFTDRAHKVMQLANEEARRFNHEYLGTEHILLGLTIEGSGVSTHVLQTSVKWQSIRFELEKIMRSGPTMVTMAKVPQTPRAKKVIEYSMDEARNLGHSRVGAEHILLGLLREQGSVAAQVLTNLGLRLDIVRVEVLTTLGAPDSFSEETTVGDISKFVKHILATPDRDVEVAFIAKVAGTTASNVAVDIGNSQIKFGQFLRGAHASGAPTPNKLIPEPTATLELPIDHKNGLFDFKALVTWCETHLSSDVHWLIGSVNRRARDLLLATITAWAKHLGVDWRVRRLTYLDVPLPIRVEKPARTGIDRLLAAVAANRLRSPDRAAIVVDLGTAITVDLVEVDGGFAGGAILPGIGMAGRALADQTDALPHIVLEHTETPPSPLGKTTKGCIEAGLYWGAVGAVGELVAQLTAALPARPEIFITGGAARSVADSLDKKSHVRYVPHLVLAGIALLDDSTPGRAGG